MRNISFALTTEQICKRTKTVTRRVGWRNLKPGTLLQGVVKCQGLKKGQKVEPLCVIRVVDVRREPLRRLWEDFEYGKAECIREGFPDWNHPYGTPNGFMWWFAESHGITIEDEVTRIEFEYV